MKQTIYGLLVLRTASNAGLAAENEGSASTFAQAAAVIKERAHPNGIVFAHLGQNEMPRRTAQRLAWLVGCETVVAWKRYWGATESFALQVIESCPQKQLLVLVCHEPAVDTLLMAAGMLTFAEIPRLTPYGMQVVVTQRRFSPPRYKVETLT